MKVLRFFWFAIVLLQLLVLTACRNEDGEKALRDAVEIAQLGVESIEIRALYGTSTLEAGTQANFTAIGIRADSSELEVTDKVSWSSNDTALLTVSQAGLVTAGSQDGNTALVANWGGIIGSLNLSVSTAPLVNITYDGFPASLSECLAGTQLSVMGQYGDGRSVEITHLVSQWLSADATLATISGQGIVNTLASGSVQLTAQYGGESVSQTMTILDDLVSLAIEPATDFSMEEGVSVTFTADGNSGGTIRDVSNVAVFSAQTPGILSFDASTASTVAQGSTLVSASCGGLISNDVTVTVTPPKEIASLEIRYNGSAADPVGPLDVSDAPIQLRAFLIYTDGSELEVTNNADLSWNENRTESGTGATIDKDGSGKGEVDFNAEGRTEMIAVYDTDDDYFEDTIDILVD